MRYALALAAVLIGSQAFADDAKPKDAPKEAAKNCYVEGSAMVRTNQQPGPRVLQEGIAAGCHTTASGLNVGGFARLDMGSGQRQGTVGATLGLGSLATGSNAYALGGYQFDATAGANTISIQKGGVFIVGAGIEQKISGDVSAFVEVTKDLASVGAARGLEPLYQARTGLRVNF